MNRNSTDIQPDPVDAPAPTPSRLYWEAIVDQAPRILGLMDRETFSPTTGCCDRTYWAWKFVDFPGARFQESACVLSFLYATAEEGSPYYHNPNLLTWIARGLDFWAGIQYPDGSFDEAYPYERSLAATAFTAFYVSEALALLEDHLPAASRARCTEALRKAGDWLIANDETHGFLSNHLAAAAAALYHIYRLTDDGRYEQRSRYFLDKILRHQSEEGWYEEYGGADPGYQTHGSFYLARYWQLSRSAGLFASLEASMRFLSHCIHPDGSLGGEYASRNTQTYYPAAFEMLAPHSPIAAWIAHTMRPSVRSAAAAGLRSVDPYNYFPLLNNLVFCYRACAGHDAPTGTPAEPDGPAQPDGLLWFPLAGIARIRRPPYDAYVGTRKGGVLKVFDRNRRALIFNDCGYIGRLKNGRFFASQFEDPQRKVTVEPDRIVVEGPFVEVPRPVMTPFRFILFRAFNLTAARIPGLARWLKNLLVKALIYKKRYLDLHFRREIQFMPDRIVVRDALQGRQHDIDRLHWEPVFTTIHMGSSRYFIPNELNVGAFEPAGPGPAVDPQALTGGVALERTVSFKR